MLEMQICDQKVASVSPAAPKAAQLLAGCTQHNVSVYECM